MKILVIGPFPEPIFGVSLSNVVLTTGLRTKGFKVKTINTSTSKKINPTSGDWSFSKLVFFKYYLQLFKVINSDVIYCTTGQSFFGILKYAPFVLLARVLNRKTVVHVKGGYLKASYEEFVLRTTWPSWPALQKSTIVVIIGSIIFAMLVFVMDKGITTVLDVIYRLFA